jgi:putative ABC transport system permease protein
VRPAPLDRKVLRDLWRMRMQVLAIALLIACGVSVAVMSFSAQRALVIAQSRYYQATRFADVFAQAKRARLDAAKDLARIDGVVAVDPRAMNFGLMQIPGMLRPATARLISLPDDPTQALNKLVLIQGRYPDANRTDEALALKTFLDAAHVALGERVTMVVAGRRMSFKVVGSALSPEFVYVPGPASMMPDEAHQGVFWAPRTTVEKATGLGGAFSMVSLKLAAGAHEPAVLAAVDRILAPYGGTPAVGRADQVSNKFQQERIDRFGIIAWVIPPVFLTVAAALVQMVLGRLVDSEREQIGLLKAFGYGNLEAAAIYVKMAALIGLVGAVGGGLLGGWMGRVITQMLAQYMRFPRLELQFSWKAFLTASVLSAGAAMAGSLLAARRAALLAPAIAMRPPTPAAYRKGLLEGLPLWRHVDEPSRMIVRNLERFPMRAGLTLLGLAVSLSLLVGSQFMFGSLDEVLDQAYFRARHWSDAVAFAENRDAAVVAELRRLPGVTAAEGERYAAVRIRAHGHEEKGFVAGLSPEASLSLPLDAKDRRVPFMGRGLILSGSLAGRLGVRPGDAVELEVTEGRRPRVVLPVTGETREYAGLAIYMDRRELGRIMGEGDLVNLGTLQVESDRRADFYRAIEAAPMIVGAASRTDTVAVYRTTFMRVLTDEMTFFAGFAAAIAFGVAFNVARIALSDRGRDLATLRVLGFDQSDCAYILLGELFLLALAATPVGVLGGMALARTLVAAFARQEMQLPMIITARSYGVAFSVYLAAVAAAAAMVGQRLWRLDLVAVLKTRE